MSGRRHLLKALGAIIAVAPLGIRFARQAADPIDPGVMCLDGYFSARLPGDMSFHAHRGESVQIHPVQVRRLEPVECGCSDLHCPGNRRRLAKRES